MSDHDSSSWKFVVVLGALSMLQAGRVFFWEVPGMLGMGPDSIAEHFIKNGVSYTNEDNAFFSSAFAFGGPIAALLIPFAISRFGLMSAAQVSAMGTVCSFAACIAAIMSCSILWMNVTRVMGGFFAGTLHPITLTIMVRWYGSGASSAFSFLVMLYRSLYVVNAMITPFVSQHYGLFCALIVGLGASWISVSSARIVDLIDKLAQSQGEMRPEAATRRQIDSITAFGNIPSSGVIMAFVYGLGYAVVGIELHLLKNFWQVRHSMSPTEAGAAVGIAHASYILGGLIAGQILEEIYCPGFVLVFCATAEACALLVVANTRLDAPVAAIILGLPLGAFIVTAAPALGNFSPLHSGLIYGLANSVEALCVMAGFLLEGLLLDAFSLPPCGAATPLPGGMTAAPDIILWRPPQTLQCSNAGLADVDGYRIVLNALALVALALTGLVSGVIALDKDDLLNSRHTGADSQSPPLADSLLLAEKPTASYGTEHVPLKGLMP